MERTNKMALKQASWELQTKETVERWFRDPDTWVGCFENEDLGHPSCGRKTAMPFRQSDGSLEKAEVGKTRAPDTQQLGFGWRYILKVKATTAKEVLDFYGIK